MITNFVQSFYNEYISNGNISKDTVLLKLWLHLLRIAIFDFATRLKYKHEKLVIAVLPMMRCQS